MELFVEISPIHVQKLLPFRLNSWSLKKQVFGLRHVLWRKRDLKGSCVL